MITLRDEHTKQKMLLNKKGDLAIFYAYLMVIIFNLHFITGLSRIATTNAAKTTAAGQQQPI
jgi:hypothetical protein